MFKIWIILTWDTHNLWVQMSPDRFSSAVLLRSLNSHAFVMFSRRPRNSSALTNTSRSLDAYYLYSHILLPTFRIFNQIRPLTVANQPLHLISRVTLVALSTTSTSLIHCLLVLNKPLRQLPQLSQPKASAPTPPSGSAITHPAPAAS